jgi:S-DNA-T family DNA segregation ATPase FtsK/SpoIIIE
MASETKSLKLEWWHRFKNWQPLSSAEIYQREMLLVATIVATVYLLLALISFSPTDPSPYAISLPPEQIQNAGGLAGAYLAGTLVYIIGLLAFALPWPFLIMAALHVANKPNPFGKGRVTGWLFLLLSLASLLHRIFGALTYHKLAFPIAGQTGKMIFDHLAPYIGLIGHDLLLGGMMISSLLMITRRSLLKPVGHGLTHPPRLLHRHLLQWWQIRKTKQELATDKPPAKPATPEPVSQPTPATVAPDQDLARALENPPEPMVSSQPPAGLAAPQIVEGNPAPAEPIPGMAPEPAEPQQALSEPRKPYEPPPLHIFRSQNPNQTLSAEQQQEFEKTANQLIKILQDFNVEGQCVAIQPGPVVAVYEFQPKAGTKLSKVTGLIDDIALALKVDSIFIHPVSGKRALGIQVPNQKRETVYLGDILKSAAFAKAASPLTFAMGKSLSGEPICEDLATMPHLLTAGQTGSGKSVAINSLLCSIILKAKPEEVRMILVDPKILELKVYEGIPHLLMPVITEAPKASLALKWACMEMDRRYQLMELARVRHITGFNQYWEKASVDERAELERLADTSNLSQLPYIVIVIDELADLMLTAPKDVESSIQRLAQKARASGIHLVLATQRPSVDVITGVIKANLPCRSSFKVFSRGDSRTVLDCIGAERLLGKGDMLFLKPGTSRLQRIQGAFLDDSEVVDMVEAIKKDSEPHYDEAAIAWIEDEFQRHTSNGDLKPDIEGLDDNEDPKWDEALAIAQSQGHVSASFLQRNLKIGYNRAARIVETMEAQGLVGPADGSKPRKWLGPAPV